MHYWADLQSVHGFGCRDSIASNAKCQRVLVLPGFNCRIETEGFSRSQTCYVQCKRDNLYILNAMCPYVRSSVTLGVKAQ